MGRPEKDPARQLAQRGDVEQLPAATSPPDVVEVLIPDTNGVLRGKWLPGKALKKVFDGSFALPLSIFGLDVWGREVLETGLHLETGDKDGHCLAVPGSLKPVPWAARDSVQVLVSMYEREDVPFFADPRHRLAAVVERLAAQGLTPVVAFELEFYLVKPGAAGAPDGRPVTVYSDRAGPEWQNMYGVSDLNDYRAIFDDIHRAAELQGVAADAIISEAAPGQFEVNLHHRADALAAADDAVLLRRLIKAVARSHGLEATFMAKPFIEWPGNGMHVHVSLADADGVNVFADEEGATLLRQAVAGTLETMPELLAIFINSFNGYRRLAPGSYAPTRVTWGRNNRSVAVRVPSGSAAARRLEHRIAGADANPHLVLAGILSGMMRGLEARLEPPPAIEGNAYAGLGVGAELTDYMEEAVEAFEMSDFVAEAFGTEFRRIFSELKKAEQAVFDERISRLEHETYL
ncbi:MAG: glutamine synthetase [Hyphomicrobiales bacterium]|nr:glutamine synthetase [Hyphomicrobiales bacterium]